MGLVLVIVVGLALAWANGANDNFKGVATLAGSGTTTYRRALIWATATTLAGSIAALMLARGLLSTFSGKGLVPDALVADPRFPASVALAAAATVLVATRLGLPVSTTHALIGGLVGAGLLASPSGVDTATLANGLLLPLLTSPIIAAVLTLALYPPLTRLRERLRIEQETCLCVGNEIIAVIPPLRGTVRAMSAIAAPAIVLGTEATCRVRYQGKLLGMNARWALDAAHYASAGVLGFARGLNDTPKIAALLLAGGMLAPNAAITAVGGAIAIGGWLGARRVAETMSHRITAMNPGQGFLANIVAGSLVVGASRLGLPVSTTHVSCGSLFGIGAASRQARWQTIGEILLAWVVTLPLAALLGALAIGALRTVA